MESNTETKRIKYTLTAKRITTVAALSALALITFMIESLFPPLFVVGAKMGLSNIFVLFALATLSLPSAFLVVTAKCVVGNLIVGNLTALIYSLSAGFISLGISSLLFYFVFPKISIVSISVVGAVVHNICQNVVFCLLSGTALMLAYIPYLALVGILSGIIIGIGTYLILRAFPLRVLHALYQEQNGDTENENV